MVDTHLASPGRHTTGRLPALPTVLLKLLEFFRDGDASFARLARIVKSDAALTANILQAAHAARFGPPPLRLSVEMALARLGLQAVRTIALSSAVRQLFASDRPGRDAVVRRCWHRSIACAGIAEVLAEITHYENPEEAYLGGLLHDIGCLVLWLADPARCAEVLELAREPEAWLAAERDAFGTDHVEAGAALIDGWRMRSFLVDAVRHHHGPLAVMAGAHPLIRVVYLANLCADAGREPRQQAEAAALALFGLSAEALGRICAEGAERARALTEALGLAPGRPSGEVCDLASQQLLEELRDFVLVSQVQTVAGDAADADLHAGILAGVEQLTGLAGGLLLLRGDAGLRYAASSRGGDDAWLASLVLPTPGSTLAAAAADGGVMSVWDAASLADAAVADRQLLQVLGGETLVSLALRDGATVQGLMVFAATAGLCEVLTAQQSLLALFAGQVGEALGRAVNRGDRQRVDAAERSLVGQARARVLAHEVAGPLTVMKNYLALLGMKLGGEHPAQEDLRYVRDEIDRVAAMIRDYAHRSSVAAVGLTRVNRLAVELGGLFEASLPPDSGISVRLDLDEGAPAIATEAALLRQVLLNLVRNAAEAMVGGGQITIATHDRVRVDGEDYFEVTVADNGPGIPAQVMDRLFQPTASSKGGEHAGMGLAIAKTLVQRLGGRISCRSSPRRGTVFQVLVPRLLELPEAKDATGG